MNAPSKVVRTAALWTIAVVAAPVFGAGGITPVAVQLSPTLRPPNLEYWWDLRTPTIDNQGNVVFRGLVDAEDYDGQVNSAFRTSEDRFLAQVGDPAPGLNGGKVFRSLTNLQASPHGPAAFVGYVDSDDASQLLNGIWAENADGDLRLVAIQGAQPPGLPDGVTLARIIDPVADNSQSNGYFPPFTVNGRGETAFQGELNWSGARRVDVGIWSEGGGRGLRTIAYLSMEVPQIHPDATIFRFNYTDFVPINLQGVSAFVAEFEIPGVHPDGQALFLDDPAQGLLVAVRSGQPAPELGPDVHFSSFLSPRLNNAGQLVFIATVTGGELGSDHHRSIWSGAPSDLQLVARVGAAAPGVEGTFSELPFSSYDTLIINGRGHVAFAARIAGPGIDETNDSGIWAQDKEGRLRLVVREGQLGPNLHPSYDFSSWDQRLYMNNLDQIAFATGGRIWATDLAGNIHDLIGPGAVLPVHSGPSTGNEDGFGTSFNDRGEFAFYGRLHNRNGVFVSKVVAVPEPAAVLMTTVALLASNGLCRRRGQGRR